MNFTARVIADFTNGEIIGNPDEVVTDISRIEEGKKGTLAFLANPKYEKYLYDTEASIVLVNRELKINGDIKATLIRVDNAYNAFTSLLELYAKLIPDKTGIEQPSYVDPSAMIGDHVYIGAFAYVGPKAVIGNNVKIYPQSYIGDGTKIDQNTLVYSGVKIYHDCQIGSHCIIHSGSVIGGDGFGFVQQEDLQHRKIPQVGNVIVEDHVEIGSNVTIDRATIGSTIIRKGVKLDNLIQIAHNVKVGDGTLIAAQTGIAGSTVLGAYCVLGGQVGIVPHIEIGDRAILAAQSGATKSIRGGEVVFGRPARPLAEVKRREGRVALLEKYFERVKALEKEVAELKKRLK